MTEIVSQSTAARHELIAFRVGDQEFCVDIMQVREIRGWTQATPLPRAPNYIKGVINLRGAVLPVVDLGARLGLAVTEVTARHVIMVVNQGSRTLGLLVEAVSDIINMTEDMIQPTPDVACDTVKTFVKGLFSIDGRMISLISLERVLPEVEAEAA
ncbi:chemotaxis protein CheW [Phenylobacterium aquaticum]|jgi:purine-binding chemotaxis protein CheW|uniref:chemotaxis protein CheW n=1 Tax=Phenylobacterium aquaticum TaxID=1763816 RepID=UPI001F5C347A|nr:chemotaxis protein CheW [Phenylobacterium aquaticum]MCI3131717.1 chemotaxis protein CheW [Phenylobacterium aquaticum]